MNGLKMPKEVAIIRNEDVDLENRSKSFGNSRPLPQVQSSNMTAYWPQPQLPMRRQTVKSQEHRGVSFSPDTSENKSKSRSRSFQRTTGQRSNFNKNAQIKQKFNQQEKELKNQVMMDYLPPTRTKSKPRQQRQPDPYSRENVSSLYNAKVRRPGGLFSGGQSISKSPPKNLKHEYEKKAKRMNARLNEQVKKHTVVKSGVTMKVKRPKDIYSKNEPSDLDFIPGHEDSPVRSNQPMSSMQLGTIKSDSKPPSQIVRNEDVVVHDYIRSKKAVHQRISNELNEDREEQEVERSEIFQELSHKLIELDNLNEEKRDLNNKLISQIKFVRDLQSQLGTSDNGHLKNIVDKEMEKEFKVEKKNKIVLKESIKKLQNQIQSMNLTVRDERPALMNKLALVEIKLGKYGQKVADSRLDIQEISHNLDLFQDPQELNAQIESLQKEISLISQERVMIAEDLRAIQSRYDEVHFHNERQNQQIGFEYRMTQRRKLGKMVYKALEKMIRLHKIGYFDEMKRYQKNEDNQIASIIMFRNICYNYRQNRQKKYLQQWFQNALKPMDQIQNTRMIADFQLKNAFLKKFMTKWHDQSLISEKLSGLHFKKLNSLNHSLFNYYKRHYRMAFDQWRTCTKHYLKGRKNLLRFIVQLTNMKQQRAILKWQNYVKSENLNIRLHSEAVRFTVCHFKQRLFYAWREQIRSFKTSRLNLEIRTWQSLQKFQEIQKERKLQVMSLIKLEDDCRSNLLRITFNALKLNKQTEKKYRAQGQLYDQEYPKIEDNKGKITMINDRETIKIAKRSIKNGVITPWKKYLYQYFEHWKNVQKEFKIKVNDKLKQKLIKMYQRTLMQALTKWKVQGTKKLKRKRMMMTETFESQNTEFTNNIIDLTDKNNTTQVRQVQKGHLKFKKLYLRKIHAELRHRMNQWRKMLSLKDVKAKQFDKNILGKMRKRFYRAAFDKLRDTLKQIDIFQKKQVRASELSLKFQSKLLLRVFNAWSAIKSNNIMAKKAFKRIMKKSNSQNEKLAFGLWKLSVDSIKRKKLFKKQMIITQETQNTIDDQGTTEDLVFQQERKKIELVSRFKTLNKKTIKKVISQWKKHQTYSAFCIWKGKLKKYEEAKQGIGHSIFRRLYYQRVRDAFNHWRRMQNLNFEAQANNSNKIEKENEQNQKDRIKKSKIRIEQIREKTKFDGQNLVEEQVYKKKLRFNHIEKIIRDRQKNFVVNRKAHLFDVWRQLAEHRAKCLKNLQKNVIKNMLQKGLDGICIADYTWQKQSNKNRKLLKLIRALIRSKERQALTLWKQNYYENTIKIISEFDSENYHKKENSNIIRKNILKKRTGLMHFTSNQLRLKRYFIALFDYKAKKIHQKLLQKDFSEKLVFLRQRKAIHLWQFRSIKTIQTKNSLNRLKQLSKKHQQKRAFLGLFIWKNRIQNLKRILKQIKTNVFQENLRCSWDQLKQKAKLKNFENGNNQNESVYLIDKVSQKLHSKNLRFYFDKFLINSRCKNAKNKAIKQIFDNQFFKKRREIFNKWRRNANLLEIIRFQNQEGPIRLQVTKLNQEIANLKVMIKDKMIINDDEIQGILDENEREYRDRILGTIKRARMFKQGYEWLKPYCFNKLKQYVKERKVYSYHFKQMDKYYNPNKSELAMAFDFWRAATRKMNALLEGKTQQELFDRTAKNQKQLNQQADELEDYQDQIGDLKHQREYLIEKVVLSQRLALARCRFSYKFALEQAWVKLNWNSNKTMKAEFDKNLTGNVGQINELKEKMITLQQENEDIAEQNEALQEGAMEGMESLQEMEEVQTEVQKINEQLMKQAETIKKLLQENKRLKKEVEIAEDQDY